MYLNYIVVYRDLNTAQTPENVVKVSFPEICFSEREKRFYEIFPNTEIIFMQEEKNVPYIPI